MAVSSPFPSPNFQPIVPMAGGAYSVAPGYKAKFYAAGTVTPKTIYTDPNLAIPYAAPSNTAVLDSDGRALIYLGTGGYKLVLTDPSDNPVPGWTIDNIIGAGSFGTGFAANFEALKDVNTVINQYTYIPGYYTAGDGGSGFFYAQVSGDAADGGYIQDSTFDPTYKWFRVPDESNKIRSASYGAIGLSTNKTSNMMAADAYATSQGLTLLIDVPTRINTMTFSARTVEFAEGAFIRGFAAAVATFTGVVSGPNSTIFSHSVGGGLDVVLSNASQISNPYWFEGDPSNSAANNLTPFSKWQAAGAGAYILPPGAWVVTGTFPTLATPTIFYGTVNGGRSGVQFSTSDSVARFGNYQFAGNGKNITDDGGDGAIIDGDFTTEGILTAQGNLVGEADADITGTATAGSFETSGGVTADGNIAADGNVTAGASITADGAIYAGNNVAQANGFVSARAGTGANYFKASGCLFNVVGAGTGSIPAASVVATGDSVRITTGGTFTGSASDFVTLITVGGQPVLTSGAGRTVGSGGSYYMETVVTRTGATTADVMGHITWSNAPTDTQTIPYSNTSSVAITWANANTVAASVSGTGVTPTQKLLRGDIYPV